MTGYICLNIKDIYELRDFSLGEITPVFYGTSLLTFGTGREFIFPRRGPGVPVTAGPR